MKQTVQKNQFTEGEKKYKNKSDFPVCLSLQIKGNK